MSSKSRHLPFILPENRSFFITGSPDAIINDSPVVGYYLAQGGNASMKTVGDIMEAEQYGLAVKKGNDKLAGEINKALAELKKNGEYDKIYKTWFGEVKK